MIDSLFEILDVTHDGVISRTDLHRAAQRMGWHWAEAPIFALLDLLTVREPIGKSQFTDWMQQVTYDPMGPYGKVLLNSALFSSAPLPQQARFASHESAGDRFPAKKPEGKPLVDGLADDAVSILERACGTDVARGYQKLRRILDTCQALKEDAALLIIDPQRSFTRGAWMHSIGAGAAVEVEPIATAFKNCASLLKEIYGLWEIMFTRCPFPPGSYDWDDYLAGIIDTQQLYFIKPGNSVMVPPFNGFKQWIGRCIEHGKNTLVIGGCTLNSCVRVSSIDIRRHFNSSELQIMVDLSICGARTRNYVPSPLFDGLSAVESAVQQMVTAGVQVVGRVEWKKN